MKLAATFCGLFCLCVSALAAAPSVWIEGEQATAKTLVANAGMQAVDPDELSGSAWICSLSNRGDPTGSATYSVQIPADGPYHLWVRGCATALGYTSV